MSAAATPTLTSLFGPHVRDAHWVPGFLVVTYTDLPGEVRYPGETLAEVEAELEAATAALVRSVVTPGRVSAEGGRG